MEREQIDLELFGLMKEADDVLLRLEAKLGSDYDNPANFESVEAAVKLYRKVREVYECLHPSLEKIDQMVEGLKRKKVPDLFTARDVSSVTIDGYRFTHTVNIRASIRKGLKEEAFNWLRNNELGDLIIETVPAQTLSSTATMLADDNKTLPDEYFTTYLQNGISMTRTR